MNKIIESLVAARALIADEAHWTQRAFARNQRGSNVSTTAPEACAFCPLGAILHFDLPAEETNLVIDVLEQFVPDGNFGLATFNDRPTTTHADVLTLFDKAIMQAVFDETARLIIEQGQPATTPSGVQCMYRTPNGLKCAVGQHIPDDKYDPRMESAAIRYRPTILEVLPFSLPLDFLTVLQQAHDHANREDFVTSYKERMREVAVNFNLNAESVK